MDGGNLDFRLQPCLLRSPPPPRLLLLLLPLVISQLLPACLASDITVYWNASNPLFKPTGVNSLPVQLQDRLSFVCPTGGLEFYEIYWTTSAEQLFRCSGGAKLFSCRTMLSYLVDVRLYSADPTAPVFSAPVYFYTPSAGDLVGMDQKEGGACLTKNMRIKVLVVDPNEERGQPTVGSPVDSAADLRRQPSTMGNNGMLLASRPSDDEERSRLKQQLNLITGSSMMTANVGLIASLSLCSAVLVVGLT